MFQKDLTTYFFDKHEKYHLDLTSNLPDSVKTPIKLLAN